MPGRIAVVDDKNRFVRWTDRAEIHARRLWHRSIHVLLLDPEGRLIIQLRHAGKDTFPRHWDTACSGHVEESDYRAGPDEGLVEVYARVAERELEEELGISTPLRLVGRFSPDPSIHYEQIHLFQGLGQGPYRLQPDEVEAVRAVTAAEYDTLEADPAAAITPTLRFFVAWLRERGEFRP